MSQRGIWNELQTIKKRTVSLEHYMISEGNHYFSKNVTSLTGAGATGIFGFRNPPLASGIFVNAKALITAEEVFDLEIWEDATLLSTGTTVVAFNNNRNSSNKPMMKAYANPTVSGSASGTLIWKARTFAAKGVAGVSPALGYEIQAMAGVDYLWKITKEGAGEHWLDFDFWWYETDNGY